MGNPASATTFDFSLVEGGLAYRGACAVRLIRGRGHDTRRVLIGLLLATWLPLVLFAAIDWMVTGRMSPLLRDLSVHTRLLVAIPLFVWAERSLHVRTGRCLAQFVHEDFAEGGADAVAALTAQAARLRDAVVPEAVMIGLAFLGGQVVLWGLRGPSGLLEARQAARQFSAPGLWYALVALPTFQFLVLRLAWRWFIWGNLLARLSRLKLRLLPTHPDERGGIGFLSLPSVGFAYVLLALSAVQAATWGNWVVFRNVPMSSFFEEVGVAEVVAVLLALGPLLPFLNPLWRTRLEGIRRYGELATDYSRQFHARWIEGGDRVHLMGSPDIQSLADLQNAFRAVEKMGFLPFGMRDVGTIVAAVLLPMVPVLLVKISLLVLLARLVRLFIGG
jgi:hypothetical protein